MPMYEVRGIETREYSVTYHIEAEDEEEARAIVADGGGQDSIFDSNYIGDTDDSPFINECELLKGGDDNEQAPL